MAGELERVSYWKHYLLSRLSRINRRNEIIVDQNYLGETNPTYISDEERGSIHLKSYKLTLTAATRS